MCECIRKTTVSFSESLEQKNKRLISWFAKIKRLYINVEHFTTYYFVKIVLNKLYHRTSRLNKRAFFY